VKSGYSAARRTPQLIGAIRLTQAAAAHLERDHVDVLAR
jgi:hypothetical protein